MLRRLGEIFSYIAERYLPDSFIFAVLLSLIAFALGVALEEQTPIAMVQYWGQGFWSLLNFSMQMVMILVTGHVLAQTDLIKNILQCLARLAKNPSQAIMLITFAAAVGSWLNWGFGLVFGALLAREMAQSIKGIHYSLLVASAYTGFLIWHAGLSGSIPLIIASSTHGPLAELTGGKVIPLSQTIFSHNNYIPVIILLITLPLINRALHPNSAATVSLDTSRLSASSSAATPLTNPTPAQHLENSRLLTLALVAMMFSYIIYYFYQGNDLNINMVNLIFLSLGLLLHKRPINYVRALSRSASVAAGIILQFPFYAGIMGMLMHSGLAASIANFFIHIANAKTFPLLTFYASGLVNLFVPSGGGHWVVQGPVTMPAAAALGVSPAKAAMAIAWGEAWTNMIQPFWAIPILAIADLHIRDIMGYCAVALLWSGLVLSLCIYFL